MPATELGGRDSLKLRKKAPCLQDSKEGMVNVTLLDWKLLCVSCVNPGLVHGMRAKPAGGGRRVWHGWS